MSSSSGSPDDGPVIRLCHLVKWPDFDGYGFNLHAEKSKPGQFIGKVDEGSPAESAGLRPGDRIIAVNDVNIANENHKQVVERVKAVPNETKLLVLDEEADKWYKERKITVKASQGNVVYMKSGRSAAEAEAASEAAANELTAEVNGAEARAEAGVGGSPVVSSDREDDRRQSPVVNHKAAENNSNVSTPASERREDVQSNHSKSSQSSKHSRDGRTSSNDSDKIERDEDATPSPQQQQSPKYSAAVITEERPQSTAESYGSGSSRPNSLNGTPPSTARNSIPQQSSARPTSGSDKLNLNMSVQEMREKLASRKKYDPKKENMDFREKYAIIQNM